jgi:2,4-dienoyl-CoA reductase-like NADH-dependent reductase (Old Yellow Enzyme family)
MTDLFSPYRLGPLLLPNRMVMAPMTRNRAGPGDVPGELNITYYVQRAGAGLIVTEGSQVSREGQGYARTPGIYDATRVDGWKRITQAVHAAGGRIFLQLWHVGPHLASFGAAERRDSRGALGTAGGGTDHDSTTLRYAAGAGNERGRGRRRRISPRRR